jgi:single-stranded DNA-binding protein
MFGLNEIAVIGRIGSAKLVVVGENKEELTAVNIAVDDSYMSKENELVSQTLWVECLVEGDKTGKYTPGRLVYATGKPVAEAYINHEGIPKGVMKIKKAHIRLLDKAIPVAEVEH